MPNTVVKLTNAESTWLEAAREDRKLLINLKSTSRKAGAFCMLSIYGTCAVLAGIAGRNKLLIKKEALMRNR